MDKWLRGKNGVLINDDSVGYGNAKKRVRRRAEKIEEADRLKERLERIETELAACREGIQNVSRLALETAAACRELAAAIGSIR